jgi:hypothetical protein
MHDQLPWVELNEGAFRKGFLEGDIMTPNHRNQN